MPHDHTHAVHRNFQFFRHDLRQRGTNARAQIDMTIKCQHVAHAVDIQCQCNKNFWAAGNVTRCRTWLPRCRLCWYLRLTQNEQRIG